jgi:ribonuclease HII
MLGRPYPSVRELEVRYENSPVTSSVLQRLHADPRKGVQKLYQRLVKRRALERKERRRAARMRRFEKQLWLDGKSLVGGVDEVGIGPMAGPVVAAAVVFGPGTMLPEVDDSKQLTPSEREILDREIRSLASGVGLGVAEVEEVDRLNVYHAGLLAMARAVAALSVRPDHLLVDARTVPGISIPQWSLTRGDTLSFSIAAASVVAKVYRDGLMQDMDDRYPGYGFGSHKGYCSPAHQEAVRRLGPCPIHRRSYDFIRELRGEYDPIFYQLMDDAATFETLEAMRTWEARLDENRDRLSPRALRKLRSRARRRSRALGCV